MICSSIRFPAERLERSSSWSEMNHQYGYIQASSSQEVPEVTGVQVSLVGLRSAPGEETGI
jgi:hypothetical protein